MNRPLTHNPFPGRTCGGQGRRHLRRLSGRRRRGRRPRRTCTPCPRLCRSPSSAGQVFTLPRPEVQADVVAHADAEARREVPEAGRRPEARERGEAGRRPWALCQRLVHAQAGAARPAEAYKGGDLATPLRAPLRARDRPLSLARRRPRRRARRSSSERRSCWRWRSRGRRRWPRVRGRARAAAFCLWWSTWCRSLCAGCREPSARCEARALCQALPSLTVLGRLAASGSFPPTRRRPPRCCALRTRPSARRASTAATGSTTRAWRGSSRIRPSASRARCVGAAGPSRGPPRLTSLLLWLSPRPAARLCSTRTGRPT